MQYIVFDLEFNQDFNEKNLASYPNEIIQIGAVKLNSKFDFIDNFSRYVKPTLYSNINPYVEELTGISMEKLLSEQSFPDIYQDFIKFIGQSDTVFCVWGMADIKELFKNVKYFKLDQDLLPKKYINLQPYVSKHFGLSSKKLLQLKKAVELLCIPITHEFHDALNDAYYTAAILKIIYNRSIKPMIYDPDYVKTRPRQRKIIIDFEGLIKQFEKMYLRPMSQEEQEIIKLAYQMGRTQQFLTEICQDKHKPD